MHLSGKPLWPCPQTLDNTGKACQGQTPHLSHYDNTYKDYFIMTLLITFINVTYIDDFTYCHLE